MIRIILVWVLAVLCTANSLVASLRSSYSAGLLMMWGLSVLLILYGIFHKPIDLFLSTGFGQVVKYALHVGIATFVGLFLFVALSGYSGSAKGDEKAIIVLGAGLRGDRVSDVLRRRLVAALETHEENPTALIVVTGGQGPGESIPEGLAMQRWLVAEGVDPELIIIEDKSVSTEENLQFAKELLAQRGVDADEPVAVVTNAFHCYRAKKYAQGVGFANTRTVAATMNVTAILPSYFREMLAILFLWVFRRQYS